MTVNLLQETIHELEAHGKTLDDVQVICGNKFQITKEEFLRLADIEYDNGFGGAEIAGDLTLVGEDFWLERREYDGSEWWEYKTMPTTDLPVKKAYTLFGGAFGQLESAEETDERERRRAERKPNVTAMIFEMLNKAESKGQ